MEYSSESVKKRDLLNLFTAQQGIFISLQSQGMVPAPLLCWGQDLLFGLRLFLSSCLLNRSCMLLMHGSFSRLICTEPLKAPSLNPFCLMEKLD